MKALLLLALLATDASPLPAARLQGYLQRFADGAYLKSFRHLGEERDFDHGHLLFADSKEPVAILYHTQELAYYDHSWLDPEGRNWVQWLSDGRVENAKRYERRGPMPALPAPLEALRAHKTVLPEMLEPSAFGARRLTSRQVVFTRAACGGATISVRLRGRRVCLSVN